MYLLHEFCVLMLSTDSCDWKQTILRSIWL